MNKYIMVEEIPREEIMKMIWEVIRIVRTHLFTRLQQFIQANKDYFDGVCSMLNFCPSC
jgi:hypothetical protein